MIRVVSKATIKVDDEAIENIVGAAKFSSITVSASRLIFCKDYSQSVTYDGPIPGYPESFDLDDGHRFYKGQSKRVCGDTAAMCSETRFKDHLIVTGDRSVHYGRFDCCSDESDDSAVESRCYGEKC